jgi:hypothetical protein
MKKNDSQGDLFVWADSRPSAEIIDLVPIIVRTMPDVDPTYPEPAKVLSPKFGKRDAA